MTSKQLKEYIRDQVRIEVAVLMPRLLKEILTETLKQYAGPPPVTEGSVFTGNSEKRGRLFDHANISRTVPAAQLSPQERRNMYAKYIQDAKPAHVEEREQHQMALNEGKVYDGETGKYIEIDGNEMASMMDAMRNKNYSAVLKK